MEKCPICRNNRNLINHHTRYYPEETMLVCESCHRKIHNTPNFYDNLCPEWYVNGGGFRNKINNRKHSIDKIKDNRSQKINLPVKKICEAYNDGCGTTFLADVFGVSTGVIVDRLKKNKVYDKYKVGSVRMEMQWRSKLEEYNTADRLGLRDEEDELDG